jgi:glucose-6-phosphate 1-dehydrogenase
MTTRHLSPTALVIFGITGNLVQRKLMPALYHLESQKRLPEQFSIVAIFHGVPDMETVMQQVELQLLRDHQDFDPDILLALRKHIRPIQMDSTNAGDYAKLREELDKLATDEQTAFSHLFYLAIPPSIFEPVIDNLASVGLNTPSEGCASRVLVEKPFGNDLHSARELIEHLGSRFEENQIFRIDHYLAKETAQNILAFRFDNPLIEGIWSRQFIDHIQITMSEKIGIQGRVAFYEGMGALRDIVQNHLMQLIALVMMEYPDGLSGHAIHKEKLRLLESIERISPEHVDEVVVRGQYEGYAEEVANSSTKNETYVALKLEVANSRWGGVPILLRTGKAMATAATEIRVVFKDRLQRAVDDNLLIIRIQPNEGISLKLVVKRPGFTNVLKPVEMSFDYHDSFTGQQPDPYQRVLVDAMRGDQSLFATGEEIMASWELLQPILDYWHASSAAPEIYEKGSWGVKSADTLAASYGCNWFNPDPEPEADHR